MKSKAILTRQQCDFAFVDKTSFFTDLMTVGSMDSDWLIPFTSNNVKVSITPISSQRKQANQALYLKRTHLHDNAAENGKKERILRPALDLFAKSKVIEVAGDGFLSLQRLSLLTLPF